MEPTGAERRARKLDALLEAAASIPEIVNPWALAYVIRGEEQAARVRADDVGADRLRWLAAPTATTIHRWLLRLDTELAAMGADRFRAELVWRSDGCEVREVLVD